MATNRADGHCRHCWVDRIPCSAYINGRAHIAPCLMGCAGPMDAGIAARESEIKAARKAART